MRTGLRCGLVAAALVAAGASGVASAADTLLTMPIDQALASQAAKERIDPNTKLLFGFNRLEGATDPTLYKTVKRVRRPVNKVQEGPVLTDAQLCETVFVQAVQDLQRYHLRLRQGRGVYRRGAEGDAGQDRQLGQPDPRKAKSRREAGFSYCATGW